MEDRRLVWFAVVLVILTAGASYGMLRFRYFQFTLPAQAANAEAVSTAFLRRETPLSELMTPPTGTENAADHYMEALRPFDGRRGRDEGYAPEDLDRIGPDSPMIDRFIIGGQQARCRFSPKYSNLFMDWNDTTPPFTALQSVSRALAERVNRHIQRSYTEFHPADKEREIKLARVAAESLLMLGRHLADERLSIKQVLIGEEIADMGAEQLRKIGYRLEDKDLIRRSERYIVEGARVRAKIEKKQSYLVPLKEQYSDAVIKIALGDEDPAFKALAYYILADNRKAFFSKDTRRRQDEALAQIDPAQIRAPFLEPWE